MLSEALSLKPSPLLRLGPRRVRMLLVGGLALILYSVLIYGGVLTGTAAYWCSDVFWTLFSLLAAIRCLVTARRQTLQHHRRAWTFFGLAALSWFIGMLIWDYQELILGSYAPYPSIADYFFNGLAPLFIVGIFYYRSEKPTAAFTLKQAGNLGMIFSALVVVFTIVFLGPITAAGKSLEFLLLSIVHAVMPMTALLFALTVLWLYVWDRLRLIYALLVSSIALHAGTDILYNYAQLGESFGASNYLNIYWLIAFSFLYWAAWEQGEHSGGEDAAVRNEPPERSTHELEALIPALLIAGMVILAWFFRVELTYRTVTVVLPALLIFGAFLGLREWWIDRCEAELTEALRLSNQAFRQANLKLEKDIAARERAEEALRESQERYRNVVEDMPVLICRFLPDGTLTFVNQHYCQYFHKTRGELVGQNFYQFVSEKDRQGVHQHYSSLVPENAVVTYEHKVLVPDGTERWQRWTDRALFDEQGRPVEYQSIGEDITDNKNRDEALRESERRFRNLVEGSVQGIYIHREFKPLFVNHAFARILGYESADMLLATMNSVEEHLAPREQKRIRAYMEARVRGEKVPTRYEYEAIRKDGKVLVLQNAVRVIDWDGEPAIQSTVVDVTEARHLAERLSYQASHDALTDLLNRRGFEQRLRQMLEAAKVESVEHVLCYLDLDQFKVINDTCGHIAGDELLRQLGQLLRQHIRDRDSLARLGGDEFGILLERCSVTEATRVTTALRRAVDQFRFQWEDKVFTIGASIGLVSINETSESMESLLSMADAACYAAKDSGFNRTHIYEPDDEDLARRRGEMQWVTVINRALEEDWFQLYFQPLVPLSGGGDQSEGFELLLRMRMEDGPIVGPGSFFSAAERYNLATKVDRWVVGTAFDWFSRHRASLERSLICSINLSGNSLGDAEFLQYLIEQLEEKRLPPGKICFEVTETAAISNLTNATNFIIALKKRGCRFALDDFGSGLSSFAYLEHLPVDYLKIDGMFVKDIEDDPVHLAMVRSINEMGHVMGKQTIAEFVETEATLKKLREVGVDYAQGYGIARPRPLADLITDREKERVKPSVRTAKQSRAQ